MKPHHSVPWKLYLTTTFETIISFYIATLCGAIFLTHGGTYSLFQTIIMVILYLTVLICCITRIIQRFSMAALMIVIPIAPFLALVMVVSLIPLMEKIP